MKKPKNLRQNLLLLLLFGFFLAVWYFFDLPCIPRAITGIPCITCGLTRAWLAALRLDLVTAFRQYPMFWSVPVLMLYILFDGRLFSSRKINNWVLGLILAGIFLSYLARCFDFLGILLPL